MKKYSKEQLLNMKGQEVHKIAANMLNMGKGYRTTLFVEIVTEMIVSKALKCDTKRFTEILSDVANKRPIGKCQKQSYTSKEVESMICVSTNDYLMKITAILLLQEKGSCCDCI